MIRQKIPVASVQKDEPKPIEYESEENSNSSDKENKIVSYILNLFTRGLSLLFFTTLDNCCFTLISELHLYFQLRGFFPENNALEGRTQHTYSFISHTTVFFNQLKSGIKSIKIRYKINTACRLAQTSFSVCFAIPVWVGWFDLQGWTEF